MCVVQKDERAPHRGAVEDVYGAKRQISTAQESCGRCVRCKKAKEHRTGELQRMCVVQKDERAPHRKAVEDMYGAERRKSTAQESCGGYVRCGKANKHRTEELQKIYTVQKDRKTKRQKDKKTERRKEKKTNNKHHTEFRKEKV
ncbi:hypothetical protein [Butyrivibrio sp. LB2008]|uniref:hypothetical protein n=1 Tax=Butyrivibrio sp. LB2008 TaxID=1408305 RepID=UPI00047C1A5F|nr:hypothetical protein [Butyrivibrio sp. LB2008]